MLRLKLVAEDRYPTTADYARTEPVQTSGLTGNSPTRFALAEKMSQTWLAFARTGNPNNDRIPNWPPYSVDQRPRMMFDNQCRVEDDPYRAERLAWDVR